MTPEGEAPPAVTPAAAAGEAASAAGPDRPESGPAARPRPVLVRLPAHLVALFPGAGRLVALEARDVGALMDRLDERWPGMRSRLCDERPAIRRHINVFVGGERARLDTRLPPGADVFIITAISGG